MTTLPVDYYSPPRPAGEGTGVDARFVKLVVLINGLVPALMLLWDAAHHQLGANSVNFAIRTTGMLTLVFLSLSLLVTPLRKITGMQWLFHVRRNLGLYAFFYGMSHFLLFFALDRGLNVSDTISEMFKRKYLFVGSAGLLFMAPLAATSFNYMIKRLGSKRWKALHRLAYLAAIAGVLHYYMLVKADVRIPIAFAVVVGLLLSFRLVAWAVRPRTQTASNAASAAGAWKGKLRVEKIIDETPNVRTFRLADPAGGPLPFSYLPGQHLSLTLNINGKKVYRSYTIASTPTRPDTCELSIKREDMGTASRHMHHQTREGDLLEITAASGAFFFTGAGHDGVVLLAGGVGITPLMSIIRYLTDQQWPGRIHLIFSNKTEPEIIFRSELADLASRHPNLRVTHTLTRAMDSQWPGRVGRIDAVLLTELVPDITRTHAFICGPTEMITATQSLLRSLNVPESLIHTESFGTPRSNDPLPSAATFTVTFARSHQQAPAPSNKPLLEIAEDLSIPTESECRSGICGRCKCRLISGAVDMATQDALTPADRRANIILLCQAKAREDVLLDA